MTWHNTCILILRLVLVLIAHSAVSAQEVLKVQPEEVGLSSERLQRLSDVLQGYVADGKLAGG